jgi:hypothetical protein
MKSFCKILQKLLWKFDLCEKILHQISTKVVFPWCISTQSAAERECGGRPKHIRHHEGETGVGYAETFDFSEDFEFILGVGISVHANRTSDFASPSPCTEEIMKGSLTLIPHRAGNNRRFQTRNRQPWFFQVNMTPKLQESKEQAVDCRLIGRTGDFIPCPASVKSSRTE